MPDLARALSADDARILALQSSSVLGHTLKLVLLEPGQALDIDQLRARVLDRLDAFPRARDRVEHRADGPVWMRDDAFDIAEHVRHAGSATTSEDLRRLIGELMSAPLDASRPLWTADVVGPLADGSEAIAIRLHHAVADGMGGVRFLDAVLFEPHDAPAHAAGLRPASAPSSWWSRWERMPGALRREYTSPDFHSPLDRPLSSHRDLAFVAMPLERFREIGRTRPRHATVNDVLLTVVAGGLRRWLGAAHPLPRVRAQIPVSLHTAGEDAATAGNRDSFLNIDLLLREADEIRRLDGISAQTRLRKQDGDAELLDDMFRAMAHAGSLGAFARRLADSPREFGLSVSNVPGPSVRVSVAGRAVTHLYSSSEPAEHHALRVSAISSDHWMGIGLCVDPTAIADVTSIADALHDAYTALHLHALGVLPTEETV